MEDLHAVGGTPGVLKYMLEQGHLHGDCMTVTGKTMAENLADLPGELAMVSVCNLVVSRGTALPSCSACQQAEGWRPASPVRGQ